MPDEPQTTPEEKTPNDGYIYARDHGRSLRVIAREIADERQKLRAEEKPEEPVGDDTESGGKPEVEESAAPKENTPPETRERQDDAEKEVDPQRLVKETVEEARAAFRDEIKAIEESRLSQAQKDEAKKELKSKWSEEGRNPRDYDEILEESLRVNREQIEEVLAERERKAQEAEAARKAKEEADTKARTDAEEK